MEGSYGQIRGNVDSIMKLIGALGAAGIELIAQGEVSSTGGRGVRLTLPASGDGGAIHKSGTDVPLLCPQTD